METLRKPDIAKFPQFMEILRKPEIATFPQFMENLRNPAVATPCSKDEGVLQQRIAACLKTYFGPMLGDWGYVDVLIALRVTTKLTTILIADLRSFALGCSFAPRGNSGFCSGLLQSAAPCRIRIA